MEIINAIAKIGLIGSQFCGWLSFYVEVRSFLGKPPRDKGSNNCRNSENDCEHNLYNTDFVRLLAAFAFALVGMNFTWFVAVLVLY